ncbi:hypothetical protein BsWGS_00172 [Bradybaena similaris]
MISAYENRRWHETQRDVAALIEEDDGVYKKTKSGEIIPPKPMKNRDKAFDFLATRYVRYTAIAKRLDDIYNFMVHPQKRALVRTVLTDVLARILEFKQQMVIIDERHFHFLDDVIQDYGLVPQDLELHVPIFFRSEQHTRLQTREHLLESILSRVGSVTTVQESVNVFQHRLSISSQSSSVDKLLAIRKIQRNHRGYLGRRNFDHKFRTLLSLRNRKKVLALFRKYLSKWRCEVQRRLVDAQRKEDMQYLGMAPQDDGADNTTLEEHLHRNNLKAEAHLESFAEDRIITEDVILRTEAPEIAWNLKYNITQWLLETKSLLGKFPIFPPEEKGGSNLLFSQKSILQVQQELEEYMEEKNKGTKGKKGKKDKKKKKKKKNKKDKKGKKGKKKKGNNQEDEFEWSLPISKVLPELTETRDTYQKFWYYKDDANNTDQTHDRELMKEEIRLQIAESVRLQVDELMRFELENMKVAIERAKRAKEGKKEKKGKKKKKGKKGKKGRKGKKGKDLTSDRGMDELYEELVENEIIIKSPHVRLAEFIGDYSYTGCITQKSGLNPLPSLADVRKLILEYTVLPLGSPEIHQMSPLNRSVLITGLRGTGKNMLISAICTEAGANLFCIKPSNLSDKYGTKSGKKMIMHLLMKVGKALEPSVFWIDDCDTMFLKKKDKQDKSKPQKWVKLFKKTFKKIKNGDRMMLIGTTKRPYLCKVALSKFFERSVIVPYPDYASRYQMWKHFITEKSGVDTKGLDLTSLTKVTTGFTVDAIKTACEKVLTLERIARINSYTPLTIYEFTDQIAKHDPIYRAEHEAFLSWFEKTPLMKNRLARLGVDGTDKKEAGKGKKGKKGKGGKGGKKKKKKK